MGRRLSLYHTACEERVKNQALQVSNRGQCFMLATELCRPWPECGCRQIWGSKLSHFHTFTRLRSSCLTDQHPRTRYSSDMANISPVVLADTDNLVNASNSLCDKKARKYGTKIVSLLHPLLKHRRAAFRGLCISFFDRYLTSAH
jgi:hypothetical protein